MIVFFGFYSSKNKALGCFIKKKGFIAACHDSASEASRKTKISKL